MGGLIMTNFLETCATWFTIRRLHVTVWGQQKTWGMAHPHHPHHPPSIPSSVATPAGPCRARRRKVSAGSRSCGRCRGINHLGGGNVDVNRWVAESWIQWKPSMGLCSPQILIISRWTVAAEPIQRHVDTVYRYVYPCEQSPMRHLFPSKGQFSPFVLIDPILISGLLWHQHDLVELLNVPLLTIQDLTSFIRFPKEWHPESNPGYYPPASYVWFMNPVKDRYIWLYIY